MFLIAVAVGAAALMSCDATHRPQDDAGATGLAACDHTTSPDAARLHALELVGTWGHERDGVEFGELRSVAADAAGNIVIADGTARAISVIAADRSGAAVYHREGRGPGEFQYATTVAVVGDSVRCRDRRNRHDLYFASPISV